MRVLIIHNRYFGIGGENISTDIEADLLRKHGHTVELLLFDNANLLRLSLLKRILYALYTIYNPVSVRKVRETILAFRPDIVHLQNLFYEASPAIIREVKRHNIPLVMTLRNYRLLCIRAKLLRQGKICTKCVHSTFPLHGIRHRCFANSSRMRNLHIQLVTTVHKWLGTFHKVDAYITLAPFFRQQFINTSLRIPPEKFVVKPNTTYDIKPTSPHARKDFFLFVGRLSEEKGIQFLVKHFLDISMPLQIIGTGPLEEELRQTAAAASHIHFLGPQDTPMVNQKLAQCRAALFPAIWYEPFGRVIMEAFAVGTPVIASHLVSIVQHQYNGIICQGLHPQQWKEALQKFQKPSPDTLKLYAGARATFEEKYHPNLNYKTLLGIYQKLLRKP